MAPPLVTRLPKVTEYVKNIGKSVSYSTMDYFRGSMSETSDFIESNQELFRDIVVSAKNYKRTLAAADRAVRQSKIYEAGTELKKTLFESIRTGKFYDKERDAYYASKASGSMGDMSDMDDWGFDTDQFDIGSESFDEEDNANRISSAVKDATYAQSNVIAKSSEYLGEINKASTRLLFTQGERLYATVNTGLAGAQSILSGINDFLMGPMTTHMENSKKFYETTTTVINEINANLKELTEMHRNLYKRQQENYKQSQYSSVGGSSPDLKEYAKQVKKNFMEALGPEAQMILGNDMGEGSNMLLALAANPLKAFPDFIVKSLVPVTIKKSLESIDNSFSSLFSNFIARMNKMSADSTNPVMQFIGKVFGLKLNRKSTVDPAKYEKGPVPFDGVTRKTIIDVIPGHLARIEAALTNKSERVFDYETGKWTTAKDIEKAFKDRKSRNVRDTAWDVSEGVREYINELKKSNREEAERMQQEYEKLINKIYEDGYFRPYDFHGSGDTKSAPWDYYGLDKNTFLRLSKMMVGTAGEPGKKGSYKRNKYAPLYAGRIAEGRESWSRYLEDIESKGYSTARHLYNNSYDFKKDDSGGSGVTNIITDARDKYNKNIFFYLRGIYAEISYMRQTGGMSGGWKGKRKKPRGTPPPGSVDPMAQLEKVLDEENTSSNKPTESPTATLDDINAYWDRRVEGEAEYERITKNKDMKEFLESLLEANSIGAKFKVIQSNLRALTKAPGLAIAGVIDTADKRIFQMLFGSKEGQDIVDDEGNRARGFLDYVILRTKKTFDNMNEFIDDNILKPLKEKLGVESFGEFFKKIADRTGISKVYNAAKDKVKEYAQPTIDRVKEKIGWGWGEFKGSMDRTYGTAWKKVKSKLPDGQLLATFAESPNQSAPMREIMGWLKSGDITESEAVALLKDQMNKDKEVLSWLRNKDITDAEARELTGKENFIGPMARGGLVTRRGLAVISPGEKVVPVGGSVTQRNNLTSEKAFARQNGILGKGLSFYAGGTDRAVTEQDEINAIKDTTQTVLNEVMSDTKHKGLANVIASSLIGGGASLLTGMIGGPILGAAAGAAFGIAQNSGTVQRWLFGEEVTNPETGETSFKEGVISKDLQDKFKKYFPSMRDFGLAGGLAGLFTPLGLVGGLMAGSAIGFAKETDGFKDFVFGKEDKDTGERNGGVLKKEYVDRLKKAAPRMLAGTIGGVLLGPFGLLGNAVLGSAIGFATTTDKFHDIVFGKDDGTGKKKGGIVPALYRGFVKPIIRTGKTIVESTSEFIKKRIFSPLNDAVPAFIQMVKNGFVSIGDHVKDFLGSMMERTIGRPIADFLEHTIFDNVRKWTRRILKAPFALAKGIISAPFAAIGAIGNNIRRNQIAKGTAGDMTAQERLDWRKKHSVRMFGKEIFGHDKFKGLDEQLAGLKGQEGIDKMKQMKELMTLYLSTKGEMGKRVAELVRKAGEILSEFLNIETVPDNDVVTIYQAAGSKMIKPIHKAIKEGKISEVQKLIDKLVAKGYMSGVQQSTLMSQLMPTLNAIVDAIQKRDNADKYQKQLQGKLGRLSGGTLSNRTNIRRYSRLIGKEIDERETELAKAKATDKPPEETISNTITNSTQKIIDVLSEINENLKLNRMTKKERADYLKRKNAKSAPPSNQDPDLSDDFDPNDQTSDTPKVKSVGGMISGKDRDIKNATKNLYRTSVNNDGSTTIVDGNGKPMPGSKNSGEYRQNQKENEEERQQRKGFMSRVSSSLGFVVNGLFGKATDMVRTAKNGLFSIVSSIANSTGIVGKIFGGLGKLGLLSIAIAGAGHFSEFWKTTIWPKLSGVITKVKDKVVTVFGNAWNWLQTNMPNWFGSESLIGKAVTKISEFMDDPMAGVRKLLDSFVGWFKEGFKLFNQNILMPAWEWLSPRLTTVLYNAIHSGSLAEALNSSVSGKDVKQVENQRVNANGEALYYDEDGNTTTERYDKNGNERKAVTDDVSVVETKYTNSFRNLDLDHFSRKSVQREATIQGCKFTYLEYKNGDIVVRSENTGEYIRIDKGLKKGKKVVYGVLTDASGNASNGSVVANMAICGLGTAVIGAHIAGSFAAGVGMAAAAGSVIPGIGTVVGAILGVIVGGIYAISYYQLAGGGYCKESSAGINTRDAELLMMAFGLDPSGKKSWPAVSDSMQGAINQTATEQFKPDYKSGSNTNKAIKNQVDSAADELSPDAGRRRIAKARHIYQNDPALANTKFGNSTLGDAGCGPVAATNLMNKIGPGMSLRDASNMALGYQTPDGGITTDYFTDMFNRSGIGGTQTDSKTALMNSIKNGRPTVLLGKSGSEYGTPFGANDHYITAMGTDGRGNVVVEDPDLPNSSYKYPISKVMKDTTTGIMTGYSRRKGMRRRYGFDRTSGDVDMIKQTVSAIAKRAYNIIHQSEGNYNSVNKNDNGALSIGKIQWHAARAFDLVKKIIDVTGGAQSANILGTALYNEVATGTRTDWNKRIVNDSEAKKIGAFISTDIGKAVQDVQGYLDVEIYINSGKSLGLTNENALIYYADMYNQGPKYAIQVAKAAIAKAGSGSAVTLDIIHNCALQNAVLGKYAKRRTNAYNLIKSGRNVGTSTKIPADSTIIDIASGSANTSFVDPSNPYVSGFRDAANMASNAIFGEKAVSGIKSLINRKNGGVMSNITGGSIGSMSSAISYSPNSFGTSGSPTQKGLVDQLMSIKGALKYSQDWDKQDPDKVFPDGSRYASCASTVGWAYKKALGVTGMNASSTKQATDNRFTTIYTNNGTLVDSSILQPGDIMYYNWNQTRNNGKMQHTEMYAGDNKDLNHGGPGNGPVLRDLTNGRKKNLMMVRRYNGFMGNDQSGSSRRRGYARTMTSGVNASISSNARRIISQYGINTNSNTPSYTNISSDAGYQQFLSVMIDLLAVIADNTKGISDLQKAMASKGVDIDTSTIEKAAANARKRAARARSAANRDPHMPFIASQEEIQNMMHTPTGYMVQAMEALATE